MLYDPRNGTPYNFQGQAGLGSLVGLALGGASQGSFQSGADRQMMSQEAVNQMARDGVERYGYTIKPKTIREELQHETDEWLKDIN